MSTRFLATGQFDPAAVSKALSELADNSGMPCAVRSRGADQLEIFLSDMQGNELELIFRLFASPASAAIERIYALEKGDEPLGSGFTTLSPASALQPPSRERRSRLYERLQAATTLLQPILKVPNEIKQDTKGRMFGLVTSAKQAGYRANMSETAFPLVTLIEEMDGSRAVGCLATRSSHISPAAAQVSDDKVLSKILCRNWSIPTPEFHNPATVGDAMRLFSQSSWEGAVIKPSFGSHGEGISIDLQDLDDILCGWREARLAQPTAPILIEEFVPSVDLRILVFGGKAKVAMMRVPANVVGDGTSTIDILIDEKNRARRKNPRLRAALIAKDSTTRHFLSNQSLSLEAVPEKGKLVLLRGNANLSSGGDSVVVTDFLHPDVMTLAERAASAFKLSRYCGVDLLLKDFSKSASGGNATLCEVNSRAEYGGVIYPLYGPRFDSPSAFVKAQMAVDAPDNLSTCPTPLPAGSARGDTPEDAWQAAFYSLGYDVKPYTKGFFILGQNCNALISDTVNTEFARGYLRAARAENLYELLARAGFSLTAEPRRFRATELDAAETLIRHNPQGVRVTDGKRTRILKGGSKVNFVFRKWNAGSLLFIPLPPRNALKIIVVSEEFSKVISGDADAISSSEISTAKSLAMKVISHIPGLVCGSASVVLDGSGWTVADVDLVEPSGLSDPDDLQVLARKVLRDRWFVTF